jgi:hypothetical protein
MHGMLEPDDKERSAEERIEWDMKGKEDIFKVLELNLGRQDIKFYRMEGERGQAPRALIMGFYTECARSALLRYTKYPADSEYKDVSVVPVLTRRQRHASKKKRIDVKTKTSLKTSL